MYSLSIILSLMSSRKRNIFNGSFPFELFSFIEQLVVIVLFLVAIVLIIRLLVRFKQLI